MKQSFMKAQKHPQTPRQYKHDLGQNFLYDEALLKRLVEKTGLRPDEGVLEIGPGEGTLTEQLCLAAGRVISVEVDHDLIPVLRLMEERYPHLTIVEGDIRKIPYEDTIAPLGKNYQVIANIPYNITTPILELLMKHRGEISRISLMVQKEVAEKLTASPGDELYGLASVINQYYADISIAEIIPKELFTPSPKVDSAFVIMELHGHHFKSARNENHFFSIVKCGFSLRRKTLVNALKSHPDAELISSALEKLGHRPSCRAEELSLRQWIELSDCILSLREVVSQ